MNTSSRGFWGAMYPELDRLFIALWYLPFGVLLHGSLILTGDPGPYLSIGGDAYLPLYQYIFREIIAQQVSLFALIVTVFDLGVGLLLFSRGRAVKIGLLVSAVFQFFLIPMGVWGVTNVLLLVMCVMLVNVPFERSLWHVVQGWLRGDSTPLAATSA